MNDDDFDDDDLEEQIEEVIAQNGVLLHALIEVLIKKGIVGREEIEAQIDEFTEGDDDKDE
jgi:hypothetical protein